MVNGEPLRIRCLTLDEARHVVALLLSRNVAAGDIRVFSAEPIHEIGDAIGGKSRIPYFALAGAAVGIVAGYGLAAITARLYPLNTGGMPMVAMLPVGIVTYEAMMLLAVLFAFGGLLLEGRLLRKTRVEHAEAIADGEIHVVARVSSASEAENLRVLVEGGRSDREA